MEGVTRRELFRLAVSSQLIEDVECWMFYHQARNQISHAYDEAIAQDVLETAINFLPDVKKLLTVLTEKND